ncbi:hypothetical protein AVEN_82344-1 [Araneus ventricosus]|uniref:Uncharacterized protein n=1 Tax=Araneus ventricosus TaxID=182803 RepID=A0A4Y2IVK4_ARAVE|nr:hypothetical protein AVEN_82344-1 [Araneus ventricosus]
MRQFIAKCGEFLPLSMSLKHYPLYYLPALSGVSNKIKIALQLDCLEMEGRKKGLLENKRQKELLDDYSVGNPRAHIAKLSVPSWYDEKKFNRAKELYRDNFTA